MLPFSRAALPEITVGVFGVMLFSPWGWGWGQEGWEGDIPRCGLCPPSTSLKGQTRSSSGYRMTTEDYKKL